MTSSHNTGDNGKNLPQDVAVPERQISFWHHQKFTGADIKKVLDPKWDEIDQAGPYWCPTEEMSFRHLALEAFDRGYPVVPIMPFSKACKMPGWNTIDHRTLDEGAIREWYRQYDRRRGHPGPHGGFGISYYTSALVAFDVDLPKQATTEEVADESEATPAATPTEKYLQRARNQMAYLLHEIPGQPMIRVGKSGSALFLYRRGPGCVANPEPLHIFCGGGQTVACGIHPVTQRPYRWFNGSPAIRDIDDLPVCDGADIQRYRTVWGGINGKGEAAHYGVGTGVVRRFLEAATAYGIPLNSLMDYARVVKKAPEGSRHYICVGACSHAFHEGEDATFIVAVIGPAYLSLFERSGDYRLRERNFHSAINWIERKVPQEAQANLSSWSLRANMVALKMADPDGFAARSEQMEAWAAEIESWAEGRR